MWCLYQAGGPLLGTGESIDQAVDDASAYLDAAHHLLVDSLGVPVDSEDYTDLTRVSGGIGEIEGNLYLRRCTLALFEAAYAAVAVPYTVGADGVVHLAISRTATASDAKALWVYLDYIHQTKGGATPEIFVEDWEPIGGQVWARLLTLQWVRVDAQRHLWLTDAGQAAYSGDPRYEGKMHA